jgi:molybdopterin-biosynthesis enzyme MoeA-like protein
MKPMFDEHVLPRLVARAGASRVVRRRVLRIAGMPESGVDELAAPVYSRFENPKTTILGAPGQVELHLTATERGKPRAGSRSWRRRCARPCPDASSARTAASCRTSWSTSCASAG